MKKALLISAIAFSAQAQASDFVTTFAIRDTLTSANYDTLELDVDATERYVSANGAIKVGNSGSPTTGTCQFNTAGGIFCILNAGYYTLILDLGSNLAGTLQAADPSGNVVDTSVIQITEVR